MLKELRRYWEWFGNQFREVHAGTDVCHDGGMHQNVPSVGVLELVLHPPPLLSVRSMKDSRN